MNPQKKLKIKEWVEKMKYKKRIDLATAKKMAKPYVKVDNQIDQEAFIDAQDHIDAIQKEIASMQKVIRMLKRKK